MTMTIFILLQLAGVFCAYLLVTVALPAFVLGRKLVSKRLPERFMIYFMAGNFYVMNLVFILQLLKLSYPVTLIAGTLMPAVYAKIKIDGLPALELTKHYAEELKKLVGGQLGIKTVLYRFGRRVKGLLVRAVRWVGEILRRRPIDCLLTAFILIALWWIYGNNVIQEYGYKAYDIPVHNYWINAMGDNNIFVAGVYPHGFHCILYYLHAVFGYDTYILLIVFAFVENVMVHLMLLCFLRLCCKTRYAAYVGAVVYTMSTFCAPHTYSRFYATLPQEFGMMFIFPAIYFGFAFFEVRRKELEAAKGEPPAEKVPLSRRNIKADIRQFMGRDSFIYLAGFAISFAMTLAVHFYGTMIAGMFCAAMALGYGFLFFKKAYFRNVVATVIVSIGIAVLPMALAYIGGTPLQGSLRWGMNVIQNSQNSAQSSSTPTSAPQVDASQGQPEGNGGGAVQPGEETVAVSSPEPGAGEKALGIIQRIGEIITTRWKAVHRSIYASLLRLPEEYHVDWAMVSFFVLIILGFVLFVLKQRCYGAMLMSTGIYLLFMCVLITASAFGLPALMDNNRSSIYFAYSIPLLVSFMADGVLYLVFMPVKNKNARHIMHALSLLCVAGLLGYMWRIDKFKTPGDNKGEEKKEAIACLTNIIHTEDDYTWTICSANDETQMGMDHGFHYETITFLEDMEYLDEMSMVRIPTPVVYFFIEKVPVAYYIHYSGDGQAISEEGASRPLPANIGISMYMGEKRWIVMSRMYYWAQEFRKMYPNEMEVYLETDEFVCYRIEQDMNRLYNFAIDYGYNGWYEATDEY